MPFSYLHNTNELLDRRKRLRNFSTIEEIKLWKHLSGSEIAGYKFRRQHSIGPYIADFYCPLKKLIIEIDGPIHLKTEHIDYDKERDFYLKELGCTILRFTNDAINNHIYNVLSKIESKLDSIKIR